MHDSSSHEKKDLPKEKQQQEAKENGVYQNEDAGALPAREDLHESDETKDET